MLESSYTGPSTIAAVKETPFSMLMGAVDRLRKAESHASSVASKLVGEVPESKTVGGASAAYSGALGSVEENAYAVSSLADRIIESMSRIDSRL